MGDIVGVGVLGMEIQAELSRGDKRCQEPVLSENRNTLMKLFPLPPPLNPARTLKATIFFATNTIGRMKPFHPIIASLELRPDPAIDSVDIFCGFPNSFCKPRCFIASIPLSGMNSPHHPILKQTSSPYQKLRLSPHCPRGCVDGRFAAYI
jgi:hypothetical protein